MTTLTEKFAGLEELLVDQNTALLAALVSLNDNITSVNTALEIMNENNAANAKAILNAISQIDPCKPCPLPSLPIPPISTGVIPTSSNLCKRTQGFVNAVDTILGYGDLLINGGIFASPSAVYDAIGQAIAAIGNPDTTPLPSWTETVVIAADVANYIVNNLVNGYTFQELFAPLKTGLINTIYASGSVDAAKAAYTSYVEANANPSYVIPVLNGIAYSALWNYYFDPASTPDVAGYDGSICGETGTGCTIVASTGTFTGTDVVGPFDIPVRDYVQVGVSGGGGGTVGVYFDGAFLEALPVVPEGTTHYYLITMDQITLHGASGDDFFYDIRSCFGDIPG